MKLTLGCWAFGGGLWHQDRSDSIKTIHKAVAGNIRNFDTAQNYGNGISEQITGQQLKRFYNHINRSEFFIATKILLPPSPSQVRDRVEVSLRRLCLSYIDLIYIHWPDSKKEIAPYLKELNRLKTEGLIKNIGLSNFKLTLLEEALTYSKIDYIQIPLSLMWGRSYLEVAALCKKENIKIITYSPLGSGVLTNRYFTIDDWRKKLFVYHPNYQKPFLELFDILKNEASKNNKSLETIALAWVLAHPVDSVIVGSRTKEQLERTLESIKFVLPKESLEILNDASRTFDQIIDSKEDNMFFHRY